MEEPIHSKVGSEFHMVLNLHLTGNNPTVSLMVNSPMVNSNPMVNSHMANHLMDSKVGTVNKVTAIQDGDVSLNNIIRML